MIPYFDFGFLASLIVKRPNSAAAWRIVQPFPPPYFINWLHCIQVETMFVRGQLEGDPDLEKAVLYGTNLWRFYQQEGVFQVQEIDWDAAFRLSLNLAKRSNVPKLQPSIVLHVAAAVMGAATHFLSFDPRARQISTMAGLKALPETR